MNERPSPPYGARGERDGGLLTATLTGLYWMFFGTAAKSVLRIVVVVTLARLLDPKDFGLVSAALIVTGFSTILSQLGLGQAIIQRQVIEPRHLRTGFTLSVVLSILTTGCIWILASPIAELFRIEGLAPVLRAMSFLFVIQGFSSVSLSLLQRELKFRRMITIELVAFGGGYGGVGVMLAALGYGAWSLVAACLMQDLLKTVMQVASRPHPGRPQLDRQSFLDLIRFGGGFTVSRLGTYLGGQGDYFVVGRWLGAEALGIYSRAFQIATPGTLLGEIVDKVLFPAMSKVQSQRERLVTAYRRGLVFIGMTVLPASVALFVLAPELVELALGHRWLDVVAPLRILSVGMLFRASYKMSDSIIRATGAVYSRAWRQWVYAGLVTAGALLGTFRGTAGVAEGVVAAIGLNFLLMAHLSLRLSGMSWSTFLLTHGPPAVLAAFLGVEMWGMGEALRAWSGSPLLVILGSSAAAIATAAILFRYLPGIVLGRDGQWILKRLSDSARGVLARRQARQEETTRSAEGGPLPVVVDLVQRLNEDGIRYCHWKSNEHLDAGMNGTTDLDILVEREGADRVGRIMASAGYKRFPAVAASAYPAIEDFLGLDRETGKLSHVQIHHRLTLGEMRLKGYRLPWEEEVLSRRILDPERGIYVSDPNIEMLLLITRAALKLRPWLGGVIGGDRAREFAWLKERIDPLAVLALCERLVGTAGSRCLNEILDRGLTPSRLSRFRRRAGASLSRHRTFGAAGASWRRLIREAHWLRGGINRRYLHGPAPTTRTLPRGGILIAVIGADGSGKSSMVRETVSWLGKKIDVHPIYFGSGAGRGSLVRFPLKAGSLLAERIAGRTEGGNADRTVYGFLKRHLRPLWALALSLEKRNKLRRGWRARNRGLLVVCDRYPQNQVLGFNDGPFLDAWSASSLRPIRALGRWERAPYEWAESSPPEVVIKLRLTAEVARSRRPEMSDAEIRRRIEAVSSLSYGPATKVIEIDSTQPVDSVLLAFKRAVWAEL